MDLLCCVFGAFFIRGAGKAFQIQRTYGGGDTRGSCGINECSVIRNIVLKEVSLTLEGAVDVVSAETSKSVFTEASLTLEGTVGVVSTQASEIMCSQR